MDRLRSGRWIVLALCGCGGTGGLDHGGPPLVASATAGSESGALTVGSGPIDPQPDPCVIGEAADTTAAGSEAGSDDGGFKFDVGGPDGNVGFGASCEDVADQPSNLGCVFWAVDLPNDERGTPMSPPAAEQPFAVVVANVSALEDAHVQVFVGDGTEVVAAATVAPTETTVLDLGEASVSAMISSQGVAAFRIESDVPIAAYQFNPAANTLAVYSNDASLLLPENALGADYTATTADGILLGMSASDPNPVNAGAFVAVVGTVDGTTVTVDPTSALVGELSDPIVIDRGEIATILSDAGTGGGGNLSGTRVHADHPVAVFAGNVATAIPVDIEVCCADHLEHQLLPATAWGTSYAVAPPPLPDGSGDATALYRFVADDEGNELVYCPARPAGAPSSLAPGETVAFETDEPFTVRSTDPDRPLSVTQFTLSNTVLGDSGLGDPAMTVVIPLGQHERRSLFVVPAGYAANWATVVVPGDGEVRLDGEPIPPESFEVLGIAAGVEHRYVHVALPAGTHALEAEAPAGVMVYGVDEAVGYAFAGGSGARILSLPPAAG
jgi:hypothetical protein